ncbi:kelch-like protein 14 [Dendronephthya gigantea]|uniref:kelch-like protein 14 n=1 Tax=Dendronephthya gigantea TaxID=151771 RepID=UPI00106912AA|nr:kelch-like protein 14 [Dendronephthya gigantea]
MCESCGQQVNAKDEDNHKKSFCQLLRANIQVIEGIKTRQDEMFNEIKTISARQKEIMEKQNKLEETQERHATYNQNIFIIGGGYGCERETTAVKTVELYNIAERSSKIVKEFEQPLVSSALCVHDNRILVSGGVGDEDNSDEIRVLNINQHLQFAILGKLPFKLFGHDVVVHEGYLYLIGGCIWHERKTLNEIYQISLTPPYTAKLLTKMPEPRRHHKAAIVNGKLFILGGAPTGKSEDAIGSVFVYDLIRKEFKERPSLPRPVSRMSIVTWGDKIVAFGGMDKEGRAINDVIMYDTETGQSETLPAMIHKRFGSSAVITNDIIIVLGGWNKEQGYLNSVESFNIGGDRWKELPGMIEGRCWATAVVKPHIKFPK